MRSKGESSNENKGHEGETDTEGIREGFLEEEPWKGRIQIYALGQEGQAREGTRAWRRIIGLTNGGLAWCVCPLTPQARASLKRHHIQSGKEFGSE